MFDRLDESRFQDVLDRFTAGVDALTGLDLSAAGQDELLDLLRGVEVQTRRAAVADHALVAELEARGTAAELGARDTKALLRDVLRLSPAQAKARVTAAGDLGPRRALSGEALPAVFPAVAAAQADGALSAEHARVIRAAVTDLPVGLRAEHGAEMERFLVEHAHRYCPAVIGRLAKHTRDVLDPDGTLADEQHADRVRSGVLTVRRDGTGRLTVELTPQGLAVVRGVLDVLSAPRPADADGPDPRTAAQRMHDAVLDCFDRILRSDDDGLPGADAATILLTLTPDQLQELADHTTAAAEDAAADERVTDDGVADEGAVAEQVTDADVANETTGHADRHPDQHATSERPVPGTDRGGRHGGLVRTGTGELLSLWAAWSLCDQARIVPIALTDQGAVTAQGSANRIAELFNLCLLCRYHHREFGPRGWQVTMRDGIPWWTPPSRIDPDRTPVRNHMHDQPAFTPRT